MPPLTGPIQRIRRTVTCTGPVAVVSGIGDTAGVTYDADSLASLGPGWVWLRSGW